MILGFKTKLFGQSTFFQEKIWASLVNDLSNAIPGNILEEYGFKPEVIKDFKAKLHTIREDKHNRWRMGLWIDFFIGVRTNSMFRFAPKIEVKSIQRIEIIYNISREKTEAHVFIDGIKQGSAIWINCMLKNSSFTVDTLAINDGFNSTNEFFEYFSENFTGKIIHWTNLKY